MTVSAIIFSSKKDYDALNISKLVSFEDWRTQQLEFNVYYSELEYTFIEETPAMSAITLISSIGGTMSLIVSVSFFSLLEIVELFLLLINVLLNTSNKVK